jgi:eukaryotic-like serine/threonine-protein kinase
MPTRDSGRDLLFGLLALQNNLIEATELVGAFHAWSRDGGRRMSEILRDRATLDDDEIKLVEALAAKHLARHGGDTERSLSVLTLAHETRKQLVQIDAPEIEMSLAQVSSDSADATTPYVSASASGTRFRIVRPHARGGLGEVSVAVDSELNRQVALKEIQDKFADDPVCQARFVLEAEITGRLEHPGVVPVYSLGRRDDGRPYYAMRFVKGESLKEASDEFHGRDVEGRDPGERSLAVRRLLRRFVDVCNTIAYANSRGVLHRDIKPANLLLGPYGETLVVDWGLAKIVGRPEPKDRGPSPEATIVPSASGSAETVDGSALGTPAYMSPEQAAGEIDRLGPATDVYSLGATLYYVLAGKTPFEGDVAEVLRKVGRGDFPRPRLVKPAVPAPLEAVCLKAMALDPENRYATAKDVADDVEHWLAGEPVSAWVEPRSVRLRRWVRNHQVSVSIAGFVTVFVAISALSVALIVDSARRGEREARLSQDDALKNEVAARVEAGNARDQATSRLYESGRTVDKFFTDVNYELAHFPGTQKLRVKLLKEAADYFKYLADEPNSPSLYVRAQAANSVYRLGQLLKNLGDDAEGIAALREAIARYEALIEKGHKSPTTLDGLGNAYIELGLAQRSLGDQKGARESWRRAIEAHEAQLKFTSNNPETRTNLASSLSNIALSHDDIGELAAAEAAYRKVLQARSALAREFPRVSRYVENESWAHSALASALCDEGQLTAALAAVEEAIRLGQVLLDRNKDDPTISARVLWSQRAKIMILVELGRLDEAAQLAKESEAAARSLVKGSPEEPEYLDLQGSLRRQGARALLAQGNAKDAEAMARDAVASFELILARRPHLQTAQTDLARARVLHSETLAKLGDAGKALPAIEKTDGELEALATKFPEIRAIAETRVRSHRVRGLALAAVHRPEEAEAALGAAKRSATALAARLPAIPTYHALAAEASRDLAVVLASRQKTKEAGAAYAAALAHLAEAIKRCPESPVYPKLLETYRAESAKLAADSPATTPR